MPVGPLRLQTLDQSAIDREAQIQGAPAFSKLRRALLQTSTIAATEDNPAKKREMLRAAMEGTGTGFSDVSLAAHRAALNKVSRETDIANRGLELTYQADIGREAQETGIASAERMQGLSLAEARAAQERGISAEQAMRERDVRSQLGLAGFSAEIARANLEYQKPLAQGWVYTPWGKSYQDIGTTEQKEVQWKRAYQNALNNFYASR